MRPEFAPTSASPEGGAGKGLKRRTCYGTCPPAGCSQIPTREHPWPGRRQVHARRGLPGKHAGRRCRG